MTRKITAAEVLAKREPGRYRADKTLYLVIEPKGDSRHWVQRLVINGKRRDIGLGPVDTVTLKKARTKALANRVDVQEGRDPLAEKRRASGLTFREASIKTFDANRANWTKATADDWIRSLELHAKPLADMPVNAIKPADVLSVLTPLWEAKRDTARKLRQRIHATLSWAQAHGHTDHNAAGDSINGALPAQKSAQSHHAAMPYRDVPEALKALQGADAPLSVRACLRFLTLTAVRSGEARGATWAEIDTDERTWTIPADRMKGRREHRVPLSDAALATLETVRGLDAGLVFPSTTGRKMHAPRLRDAMKAAGLSTTVHGFRSSFRTWAAERSGATRDVAEMALAHAVGSTVERSYAHSDLFDQRRALMDQWSAFLT